MSIRRLALALVLVGMSLAGCAGDDRAPLPAGGETAPPSSAPADEGFVPARVLLNKTFRGTPFGENGDPAPRLEARIQETPEDWRRGWPYQFTRPDVDFGQEFVATIGWGPFNQTGAHVEVVRAGHTREGDYTVDLALVHPGPGCVVGRAPMVHAQWLAFRRDGPTPSNITVSSSERVGPSCPATRPDGVYHVLSAVGEIAQSPPNEGPMAVCGRPITPYGGLDTANRQAYVSRQYAGHDFDWNRSWLVVHDDVQVVQDSSGCDLTFIRAEEGPYNHTVGKQSWPVKAVDGGLQVGERLLAPGESFTAHVEYEVNGSRNGDPMTWHYAGDVTYRYFGAWRVRDIVEVGDEGDTWGDLRGFWGR